ncbi:MAG: sensor domain-containing diguanylate cyclase, partial [Chloroflexi bacterium]|nr:sensor domain-containing diguanylate cyclase [Chloroflexota bacterium]
TGELVIVASHNIGWESAGVRIKPGDGLMGRVMETCEPLFVHDYKTWEGRLPQYAGGAWTSGLAVPLMIGGRLLGVLGVVDSDVTRQFTPADARLANLFAQQAAIVVEKARLYQDALLAAESRAALYHASYEIGASLEAEQVYAAIHRAASQLMPAEVFVIALWGAERQEIEFAYLVDRGERAPARRAPAAQTLSGQVIAAGQPVRIEDTSTFPDLPPTHFGSPEVVRSVLAVPMRRGDIVVGVLSAQSYRPRTYTPEHEQTLSTLANQAGMAIENARLFHEVQRLATTDGLTGLHNFRHLMELGEREFDRARRYARPLVALMMDLDRFKRVNDTYGHAVGNQVLREVALRCALSLREIDILGRYGGEEFAALLPEIDDRGARIVAERLRLAVAGTIIATDGGPIRITISVGVCVASPDLPDLAALLDGADAAMYQAKQAGRNRVALKAEV